MKFQAVFTVKKEIEKEAFLRQLLINLGTHAQTPVDIADEVEFGEVRESIREVILCSAKVSGTCTASIGYDRKEPYTDYETYREKIGDSYVTRQRAVTKYRTVTDWQPFQTNYSGEATCAVDNADACVSDMDDITRALKTASKDSILLEGEATVNPNGLSRAIRCCEIEVQVMGTKFPGDRHKQERYQSTSKVETLCCYKLPFYEVTFTYEGEKYTASGFACGRLCVNNEVPKKAVDTEAEAKRMTKDLEKSSKIAWVSCFGALAVSALACWLLKFCWLWPVAIATLIYAFIANKKYNNEYEKVAGMVSEDLASAKIEALKEALAKYGYKGLSGTEGFKTEIASSASPKPPKSFTGKVVLCAILSVVVMISSFVVNDKNLHSDKQVKVCVVDKETEYDPNVHSYTNGCYYIRLDFEVEAKRTDVEDVELKVYISDKSGDELGFVRASLSDIHVKAGDKKTVTVSLEENQPERNEFFTSLYNADFSELKFRYEIGSVRFTDGKYYHNEDYNQFR